LARIFKTRAYALCTLPGRHRYSTQAINININGRSAQLPTEGRDENLLHVLLEQQGLVSARFSCGVGVCGACTVLLDGEAVRSCTLKVADVGSRVVTRAEGLAGLTKGRLRPVQRAWLDAQVPPCGYCQSGCRCGSQGRIGIAVKRALSAAFAPPSGVIR